jgi:hypothetical protein
MTLNDKMIHHIEQSSKHNLSAKYWMGDAFHNKKFARARIQESINHLVNALDVLERMENEEVSA